ncbi:hypothetical protein HDU67_005925 [Dinochytrium kinnereticum]|nr:hypothetical protein HDU67_005925 [Dinochytrium kinnereticum]
MLSSFRQPQQASAASGASPGPAGLLLQPKTVKQGWILKKAGSGFLSPWRLKYVVLSLHPLSGEKSLLGKTTDTVGGRGMLQIFDQCDQSRPAKHEIWLDESEIEMTVGMGEDGLVNGVAALNVGSGAPGSAGVVTSPAVSAGVGRKPVAPFIIYSRQRKKITPYDPKKFHLAGQTKGDTEDWLITLLQHSRGQRKSKPRRESHPLPHPAKPLPHPIGRATTNQDIIRQQSILYGNGASGMVNNGTNSLGRSAAQALLANSAAPAHGAYQATGLNGRRMSRSNTVRSLFQNLYQGGSRNAVPEEDDDARSVMSFDDAASVVSFVSPSEAGFGEEAGSIASSGFDTLSFCSEPVLTPHELTVMGSNAMPVLIKEEPVRKRRAPLNARERQLPPTERWNERYQRLLSQRPEDHESKLRLDVQLLELIGAFEEAALQQAIQMVDDYHLKAAASVPATSEPGSPSLLVVDGIILHFVCDYEESNPEQVEFATAKSSSELRSIDALNRTQSGLQSALMVLVDYKGFRIVAYADMGIDERTRPIFDLSTNPPITNDRESEKMMTAARALNLKPHGVQIGDDRRVNVGLGANVEVHHDASLNYSYAVNLFGIMPLDFLPPNAQTPTSSPHRLSSSLTSSPEKSGSQPSPTPLPIPTRRLRPEFLKAYTASPVSSDAFTPAAGCGRRERGENDMDAIRACKFLREVWIPQFVGKFDSLEIRPVDSRTMSCEMHKAGINVRYLGYVASMSSIPYIQELACIEMVARAAKSIFRSRLRGLILHFRSVGATQIEEETRSWASNMFMTILGKSEKTAKFFEERLRPEILRKFDFDMEFEYFRCLHRPAIFLAMQYQCGVTFDDTIDYTFDSPTPTFPRGKFTGFAPKRKHLSGIPVEFTQPVASAPPTFRDTGSMINGFNNTSSVNAGMTEEGRQAYLLARHFRSQGPRGKLSRSDASALRLTEVAAHYNATGRFEEARRYATAAMNAASRNSCISALAKAQIIDAVGALTATVPGSNVTENGSSSAASNQSAAGIDPSIMNLYRSAVATVEWHCGPSSPMAMALHDRMSNTCLRSRRLSQALEYHNRSLTIAMSALGKNHVVTAGYLTRMGVLLSQVKQTDSAISRLTDALNIHMSLASSTTLIAEVHGHLADALDAKGDLDSAIVHAQKCRVLREKALGQHDPRSVASFVQVSALVLKPYAGYTGVLTPAIRAAYREAISCYEKVFRFVKHPSSSSNAKKEAGGGGQWSSSASVISSSTHITTISGSAFDGSNASGSVNSMPYIHAPPVAGPGLEPPYGGPPPPLTKSIVHRLTRKIVALKLALLDSPKHKEVVRTLRATAKAAHESGQDIGFDSFSARDVICRMAAVSPSIYLDGVLARIDDDDSSAVEELAIALYLTDNETLGL